MNYLVTNLKAPWPAGTALGNPVAFPDDAVPTWAVGKCQAASVAVAESQVQVDIAREALGRAEAQHAAQVAAAEATAPVVKA